jgi:DNA topoisomerase I
MKSKQLLIVESPSKINKIKEYIDKDESLKGQFIVTSSRGHIRDLDGKSLSINVDKNFEPYYLVPESKKNVVRDLKSDFKKCHTVWLASDYDREGESIAWHISEVLKLNKKNSKRIVFTEITKNAILNSIKNPTELDINMFYAQQARRILDRLIGYLISPILWKQIQSSYKKNNSLSAGRVQSVVLKLVIEREREIDKFESDAYFKTIGNFNFNNTIIKTDLDYNFKTKDSSKEYLNSCKEAVFKVSDIKKIKSNRNPQPPFITSTLQQEASIKFRMSPKVTMATAQKLYENGYITYMRTDSKTISEDALEMIKDKILEDYGDKYLNIKQYENKSKNSQEAHEACRPCDFTVKDVSDDPNMEHNEVKLYKLIWERTVASQMKPCQAEIVNTKISQSNSKHKYIYKSETILFEGFRVLYQQAIENDEENDSDSDKTKNDISIPKDTVLKYDNIISTEKFSKPPHARYTEASLVKKLDEVGIGRPSTYSSMISIIQDRKYVERKDKIGEDKEYDIYKLTNDKLKVSNGKTKIGSDKKKLFPTDIGFIVIDFLDKHFNEIMDYQLTATIENNLDDIANGTKQWFTVVRHFYDMFYPKVVDMKSNNKLEKDNYRRIIGVDPNSDNNVYAYIGKFGPVIQIYDENGDHKYAPLKDIKIADVSLENALELFKYPKNLGILQNKEVILCNGKFGKYLKYNNKNYSLNDDVTFEEAKEIIKNKDTNSQSNNNIIKVFNDKISIKNGKYGPYICYKNKLNIKIYGSKKPEDLTLEECIIQINKKKSK